MKITNWWMHSDIKYKLKAFEEWPDLVQAWVNDCTTLVLFFRNQNKNGHDSEVKWSTSIFFILR